MSGMNLQEMLAKSASHKAALAGITAMLVKRAIDQRLV
jgi:hypothetical protein